MPLQCIKPLISNGNVAKVQKWKISKKTDYEGIGGPIHFLRKNKKTINDGVTTMNPRLWDRRNV
ncbi:hypothetical protein T10_5221 [Trichinella papuae]|uniref:Uncharacterized protein n=1 Tax=Trichinella papuae TaxID=268474 RepID=A0A0V1N1X5_9BILA|nr:hypothetical protein T10_5221 [Trichinella papuae]